MNHPVSVIAIFSKEGKITPYKFKFKDKQFLIDRVVSSRMERLAGNNRVVFECIQNEKDKYELKFEMDSQKWFFFNDELYKI